MNRAAPRLLALILLAAVCSAALFVLCYYRDNKYTIGGPRAENGVLLLSDEDLLEHPFIYLTYGWEIYRDRLLAPGDFQRDNHIPDEIVYIGQYGGLEGRAGSGRSPHGSATYRLNIALPLQTDSYILEMPEIYSACRLYIDGELMAQMGEPDADRYRAETGNRKIAVRGAGRVEIIVQVSDYSHFYSGMVYPPAFGRAQAVETMLNTRLGVRIAAIAPALGMGLLYMGIWVLLKKNGDSTDALPLLYAALCFCFALYICYPVVKTLTTAGAGWYLLENLAFPVLLLLVMEIQNRVCGLSGLSPRIMRYWGFFMCGWAVVVPLALGGSLNLMLAHSALLTAYTWLAALFLLVTSAIGVYRENLHSEVMLAGAVVFGTALAMDRLLPLFEPIRFGWFTELSGGFFVLCIGAVIAIRVAGEFRLRLQLEDRVESVSRMMEVQKAVYPEVLKKEEALREARHDLRHHMAVIRGLAAQGDMEQLIAYAQAHEERTGVAVQASYCKHYVVDMLLRMYAGLAASQDTAFVAEASLPDALPFADVDLCVIISNLLENALEASLTVPIEKRFINVRVRCRMNHFGVAVTNAFDGAALRRGGQFISRKSGGRHGIGLHSVRAVCASYGGSTDFAARDDNTFHSELLLPMNERGV